MSLTKQALIGPLELSIEEKFNGETRSWLEFSGKMGSCLWTLWQGSTPHIGRYTTAQLARTTTIKSPSILIHLIANESDKGWFIVPRIDDRLTGTRAQRQALQTLLPFESLRQQLDERKGICCPNYRPGRCQCELSWWKAITRLVQWAREGRFGDGDWRDLQPECRCGY